MKYEGYVRILDRFDKEAVEELRFQELGEAIGFRAEHSAIRWSESDDSGVLLGVFLNCGKLISTLRIEIIHTSRDLQSKLDFDGLEEITPLPVGLLGKAATLKAFRGLGLHTYLRELALQYLKSRVRFVVGTVIPGAPRTKSMEEMGYKFLRNPDGWHRFGYKSNGETLVAYLDLESSLESALSYLKAKNSEISQHFSFIVRKDLPIAL